MECYPDSLKFSSIKLRKVGAGCIVLANRPVFDPVSLRPESGTSYAGQIEKREWPGCGMDNHGALSLRWRCPHCFCPWYIEVVLNTSFSVCYSIASRMNKNLECCDPQANGSAIIMENYIIYLQVISRLDLPCSTFQGLPLQSVVKTSVEIKYF